MWERISKFICLYFNILSQTAPTILLYEIYLLITKTKVVIFFLETYIRKLD